MANVSNYGLIGVGQNLKFKKGGVNLQTDGSTTFTLKRSDNATDALLNAGGITSSGNVSLSTTGGTFSINSDTTLSRQGAGVFQFNGTKAILLPIGGTGAQPTGASGMFRYNSDTTYLEYYNGSAWISVATGGGTVNTANNLSGGVAGDVPYQSAPGTTDFVPAGTQNQVLQSNGSAAPSWTSTPTIDGSNFTSIPNGALDNSSVTVSAGTGLAGGGTVALGGTITLSNAGVTGFSAGTTGFTPSSNTTGNVTLAGVLNPANGGTGVSNSNSNTITLGGTIVTTGNFATAGGNSLTLTTTGPTNVTLPTSGTLATTGATVASFQTSLVGLTPQTATTGAVTLAGILGGSSGGTGVNNGSSTITVGGNLQFAGAYSVDFTATGATSLTLPVSGTLLTSDNVGASHTLSPAVQPWGLMLDNVNSLGATGTGIIVHTGTNTVDQVSIVSSNANVVVTNGSGVAAGIGANPTLSLAQDLAALSGFGVGTGFAVRTAGTGTWTWALRDILTGSSSRITVTNGDGVATSPTIDLATVSNAGSTTLRNVDVDAYGRVSGYTATSQSDLTSLLGTYYLPEAGGTMSGAIAMGGNSITGLPATQSSDPTSATSKAYVDAATAGLNVHEACDYFADGTNTQITGATYANGVAGFAGAGLGVGATLTDSTAGSVLMVDGFAVASGDRVMVNSFTNGTANANYNGIYTLTTVGSAPSTKWVLTRATDYDNSIANQVVPGDFAFVYKGNNYKGTGWVETDIGSGYVGGDGDAIIISKSTDSPAGDNIYFTQFSGAGSYSAGNGLQLIGTTFSLVSPVTIANGGTNASTKQAAFDNLSPADVAGDLIYNNGTHNVALGIGSTGQVLTVTAGEPAWGSNAITLDADASTGSIALGGTLAVYGTAAQGIGTSVTGGAYTITASDATAAQKGVAKFDSTNFTVTAGNVTIATGGVSNAELANSTITFAGTTGSTATALGGTLNVLGGTSPITVAATSGQLAINVADATTSSKGLASFDTSYFVVTAGAVTWNNTAGLTVSSITDTSLSTDGFMYVGTGGLLSSTAAATNGQLLIGSTGGAPVASTLTGTTNRLAVTNGAGSITLNIDPNYIGQSTITTLGTVTTGTWNATTIATNHGGTGLTSFVANEVFYAGSTSTVAQSANFTFDGTSTLTLSGAKPLTIDGSSGTITATATNSDITLNPNGTGSVIVGPSGAGLIQSDAGQALTVQGNTTLTLTSTTGNTTMVLPSGSYVDTNDGDATGQTYASAIAGDATALVNVKYVQNEIAALAISSGAIYSVVNTVSLAAAGSTNIGTVLPTTATVLRVKVTVTSADTGSATVSVGVGGNAAFMTTAENDPQTTGMYIADCYVAGQGGNQVSATVSAGGVSGSCVVFVEYAA